MTTQPAAAPSSMFSAALLLPALGELRAAPLVREMRHLPGGERVPLYRYPWRGHDIWGMTARVLHDLLGELVRAAEVELDGDPGVRLLELLREALVDLGQRRGRGDGERLRRGLPRRLVGRARPAAGSGPRARGRPARRAGPRAATAGGGGRSGG